MSHRRDRLGHVVREVVSDAIANRVSDPRVNRWTSVTRVEISADLRFADVHVSVMGRDSDARTTMQGLQSARGMVQSRLAKQLNLRHCPILRFHLDQGIKRGIETYRSIDALGTLASALEGDGPEGEGAENELTGLHHESLSSDSEDGE